MEEIELWFYLNVKANLTYKDVLCVFLSNGYLFGVHIIDERWQGVAVKILNSTKVALWFIHK